jgi:type III secretion protein V
VSRPFPPLASTPTERPTRQRFALADLALAAFVILVVGLMIVPLPTPLLDVLIATNLSAAIVILLVVLYVADAIGIATFPTLLLLATLYRLALNIASTRLILLQADAGEVIRAFGLFVVRGNYVVGAVVFLVLTIVQFIVVAKGSERVAEVGARFALDAMPGKQMAIDAELRGGSIDGPEARRRRRLLTRESQFYGAMDGAMKFVKGDVIASLVILGVNLLGGLAIGVGMRDMPAVEALRRYGLLTIGDGLVTQIPALVLSTAAGVLVTRVASEEAGTPLGEELARQILGVPKALQVASLFVLLLALVPGLPTLPFALLGMALLFAGRAQARARRLQAVDAAPGPSRRDRSLAAPAEPAFVPMVLPWSIEISPDLAPLLDATSGGLRTAAVALRADLFAEMGVPLPPPRVRVRQDLAGRRVLLSVHEVPARLLDVAPGLSHEDAIDHVRTQTRSLLRSRAADFMGIAEVQRLLDELEQIAPATVRSIVPRPLSLVVLADVLRRLLEERIGIRDLRAILEALSTVAATEKDPLALAEHVRAHMRRAITFQLTGGSGELAVILLDTTIEDTIRHAVTRTAGGALLALPPGASRDVRASIRRAVDAIRESSRESGPIAILTQPDIRRFARKVIEHDHPDVWVVTFAELLPEVSIKPLAKAVPLDTDAPRIHAP